MLASAVARTVDAALRKLVAQLVEDVAGARLGFDSSFLLLLKRPINGKPESGFLGPGQLWSGPKRCFKQWSIVQSLHLIVFENVKTSLQPGTGHFFFFVTLS